MKLAVFGATGGTGRQLIEQALEQGHIVTALARNPAKLNIKHPNLRIVEGDVMDGAVVERVITNQEVVLSTIGAPAASKSSVRSAGTRQIIQAMEDRNIRRFISLSTIGVGDSRKMLPFLYKYILVPLFLRRAFDDHEIQETLIKKSSLEWIIVRPAALTDGPLTGSYQNGFPMTQKNLTFKIARADVADFMLKQLRDNTYLHRTPGLSY